MVHEHRATPRCVPNAGSAMIAFSVLHPSSLANPRVCFADIPSKRVCGRGS